jgi:hypothetical protein
MKYKLFKIHLIFLNYLNKLSMTLQSTFKKRKVGASVVAHTCDLSYSGGTHQKGHLEASPAKS